jgi:hypothetical protein
LLQLDGHSALVISQIQHASDRRISNQSSGATMMSIEIFYRKGETLSIGP